MALPKFVWVLCSVDGNTSMIEGIYMTRRLALEDLAVVFECGEIGWIFKMPLNRHGA